MAVHAELAAAGWVLTSTDVRSHARTLSLALGARSAGAVGGY